LQSESNPELDVENAITFATRNPNSEVVDSLGAVSVICMIYGTITPDKLIPQALLTHENLSTLNGLRKVVKALDARRDSQ
jgi:hypothetical protein